MPELHDTALAPLIPNLALLWHFISKVDCLMNLICLCKNYNNNLQNAALLYVQLNPLAFTSLFTEEEQNMMMTFLTKEYQDGENKE